jgi:hypothetical protein
MTTLSPTDNVLAAVTLPLTSTSRPELQPTTHSAKPTTPTSSDFL